MAAKKKFVDECDESELEQDNGILGIHEIIIRSHAGEIVNLDAPLQKKTQNKKILARLLELQKRIIIEAQKKGLIK